MRIRESQRAKLGGPILGLLTVVSAVLVGGMGQPTPVRAQGTLGDGPDGVEIPITPDEVNQVIRNAAEAVAGESLSVAVTDRRGALLALYSRPGATPAIEESALASARTGAFFGENQAPLTSRTVRFISGIHFPPGVPNQENADLYGIENTNRVSRALAYNPGKFYPEPLNITETGPGLGINTGKVQPNDANPNAVNPGGLPLYRQDFTKGFQAFARPDAFAPLGITQIGGVGVAGVPPAAAEFAAFEATRAGEAPIPTQGARAGQEAIQRFAARTFRPGTVYVGGIKLPLADLKNARRPRGVAAGAFPGTGVLKIDPTAPGRAAAPAADGFLVGPVGNAELTQAEVIQIIGQCDAIARRTRAAIRLPLGSRARFVFAVGGLDGTILAVYRQPDATIFSMDVATAKARNAVYFSSPATDLTVFNPELRTLPAGTAITARTLNFASQPLFPAGINKSRPGPFFPLFMDDLANPGGTGPLQNDPRIAQPNINVNGIVWFPGSTPLYRGGTLIGGLGVSGDGVAQDDFVSFNGAQGFLPPAGVRSDNFKVRNVRMPYFKFPRNPTL